MGQIPAEQIAEWMRDARKRTWQLLDDLSAEQLRVPPLDVVNPFEWELGHLGWFQERFALRYATGEPSISARADGLYDSSAVGHEQRWALELPPRSVTRDYLDDVSNLILKRLESGARTREATDLMLLALFHEDMHAEAFAYTRNSLGYPAPPPVSAGPPIEAQVDPDVESISGDAAIPGGMFLLGAAQDERFTFDNERWAHPVKIEPFSIARAPVTQREFIHFIEAGGYRNRALWDTEGWAWKTSCAADHPVCFRYDSTEGWQRRHYDDWVPVEDNHPVIHINIYEAEAYCRFANRRLPTEAEWEAAAAGVPVADGSALSDTKRHYPWGDDAPTAKHANLDARIVGTADVGAFPAGDSAFGCRQMLGNVWEWTSTVFCAYPGFEPGAYAEYSKPWFGTRRVLRGGAWATRSRLIRNTWRNYYTAERRDVFAGFRTCSLDL